MNTDERRAFQKFEKEHVIHLLPDQWEQIKREFCQQRANRNSKPSEEEVLKFLTEKQIVVLTI